MDRPPVVVVGLGLVGLLLGSASLAHAAKGGFTFATPPGWLDVSRDAPEGNRKQAPPQIQAQNDAFDFQAIDLQSGDTFLVNANATVKTGGNPPPLTLAILDELQAAAPAQVVAQGISYQALGKSLVALGDVKVGRLVAEIRMNGFVVRSLQYVIPGRGAQAVLTYSAPAEVYPRYEAIFDAAALATTGAVAPERLASEFRSERIGVIVGGIAGALGAAFGIARLRKKKAAKAPATTPR